jgi:hypothetical protein
MIVSKIHFLVAVTIRMNIYQSVRIIIIVLVKVIAIQSYKVFQLCDKLATVRTVCVSRMFAGTTGAHAMAV